MSLRNDAIRLALSRQARRVNAPKDPVSGKPLPVSGYFGCSTFGLDQIKEKLPKESHDALQALLQRGQGLTRQVADEIANVIREWAMDQGASYFCHWFQPMTGLTAEKHDAFISTRTSENGQTKVIEKFTGSALIQSEPDASSFPSGGMRSTFEARGYTAWDPSSPLFIIERTNGKTLCIPSAFLSYHGHALDTKTPLLRSDDALGQAAVAFLKLLGDVDITSVQSTLGAEQEYFLVDRALFNARPDLMMTGRTLLGRASTRGQQFEDHYFGSIPSRVAAFMHEAEQELYKLGIPVKTRHNEVAPAQFEIAPIYETTNMAADHNSLMMDMLCRIALRHEFVCLLHEKPFAGINGSGKHNNWSLASQKGDNLLDPGHTPHQNLRYLALLSVVLKAVHDHAKLLRVAIATAGNDHRLGANEAPPAIISVFLGAQLTKILDKLEAGTAIDDRGDVSLINLGVSKLPAVARDNTDRNRTSPFAFTGRTFEFRAVGSSQNVAVPMCFLNAAVADAFTKLTKRLEAKLAKTKVRDEAVLELIREVIVETKAIRFEGNNYAEAWKVEAQKRGLPNLTNTPEALSCFEDSAVYQCLVEQKVMTAEEVKARYNIMLERYIKQISMEAATILELVDTHVRPAVESEIIRTAKMLDEVKECKITVDNQRLKKITGLYDQLLANAEKLQSDLDAAHHHKDEKAIAQHCSHKLVPAMATLRQTCDEIEALVADALWPLPRYRELLFVR